MNIHKAIQETMYQRVPQSRSTCDFAYRCYHADPTSMSYEMIGTLDRSFDALFYPTVNARAIVLNDMESKR